MHFGRLKFFLNKNSVKFKFDFCLIKNIRVLFLALSMVIVALTANYCNSQKYGLIVSYKGKEIAKIGNDESGIESNPQSENIDLENNFVMPEFKVVSAKNFKASPQNESEIISPEKLEEKQFSFGLYVNNELLFAVKSKDLLRMALSDLIKKYAGEGRSQFSFVEDIRINCGSYSQNDMVSDEEARRFALEGRRKIISYEISGGDSFKAICEKFGTSEESVRALNNLGDDFEMEKLGSINLEIFEKVINVKYVQTEQREKDVPYDSVEVKDPEKFENYRQVSMAGDSGTDLYIDNVTYVNNDEIIRENVSCSRIKEKVDEQVIVGTKKLEDSCLLWPVPYTKNISSPFGYRGKEFHSGIDISSPGVAGKDVLACSNGVVTYANIDNSGYGNHIKISHDGNKMSTLYAHCSKLLVHSGEKVKKGQVIANVGATGNSSGNHLHLEVLENGKQVDPKKYFSA